MNLKFTDNMLILVGENGTGKSTALSILYYFLTRQWSRLAEMPFESLSAEVNGTTFSVNISQIKDPTRSIARRLEAGKYFSGQLGPIALSRITKLLQDYPRQYWLERPDRVVELAERYKTTPSVIIELVELTAERKSIRALRQDEKTIADLSLELDKLIDCQILYLPTYRRIERDLQFIFPDIRIDRDTKTFHRSTTSTGGFVELVEFGMKDVETMFTATMQRLDREFRADLNTLTGEYLRDVIRGEHTKKVDYASLISSTSTPVDDVVARMNDAILPAADRKELSLLINNIRTTGAIPKDKEVVAHFLSKLIQIHKKQQEREDKVRRLVDVCNLYLGNSDPDGKDPNGKRLIFDPLQFELRFSLNATGSDNRAPLPPDALSSGEKQIISLFTHIYLSGRDRYLVIIDEPELSISVEWQKRFLQDIMSTELCLGLVAVTHSPFVFANQLSGYAHSMAEYVVARDSK